MMAVRKIEELPVMDLEQALASIQAHHAFLHYDEHNGVDLWSPHHKLPITLRRAIVKHRQALLALMAASDVRVCPNPMLHKRYTRGKRTCGVCLKIPVDGTT